MDENSCKAIYVCNYELLRPLHQQPIKYDKDEYR